MLDREYALLRDRLEATRGAQTKFFVFGDTVAARNYKGDNEQHGWLGIRFQAEPRGTANDVLLHVNLMDPTAQHQQEALGVLGVNLVYAALHQHASRHAILGGLFDHLSRAHLELDVIELSGPAFEGEDARAWCLAALTKEMCHAITFDASGRAVEPSAVLRKRPLIIERGQFSRAEGFQSAMLRSAERQLKEEGVPLGREPAPVLETTARHAGADETPTDVAELIEHARRANELGPVIVSDFPQTFLLVDYLRRYTQEPIRLVVGVAGMAQLMHQGYYEELPGSLLEGLGKLLATNVKVYVYPMPAEALRQAFASSPQLLDWSPSTGLVTIDDVRPPPPFSHLFHYLRESGWVMPIAPA
jgi:hypothetical protein